MQVTRKRILLGFLALLAFIAPAAVSVPANAHAEGDTNIGTCAIDGGAGYGKIQHSYDLSTSHASTKTGDGPDNTIYVGNWTSRDLRIRVRTYIDQGANLYDSGWWTLSAPPEGFTSRTVKMPVLPVAIADDWFHYTQNPRTIVDFVALSGGDAQLVSWWKAEDHGGTVSCNGLLPD